MEYDLYAMDASFLDHVKPLVKLEATGTQYCTWLHQVSGSVEAIVDDPLHDQHAALARNDAQTATAESLLAQLSAQAGQPRSREADEVWKQMQPLLERLGASAEQRATPEAASTWLRETKLPGLAAAGVFARRNTVYKQFGDEKVSDAVAQAQRRLWEAAAVAAEGPDAERYRRLVAAWYAEQSRREWETWQKMPASTAAQREARSRAMAEQQDHQRLADEQLVLASQAQAAARAQSADEAYNQGAKAGADLRRAIQAIVDRRLSAVWDQVF